MFWTTLMPQTLKNQCQQMWIYIQWRQWFDRIDTNVNRYNVVPWWTLLERIKYLKSENMWCSISGFICIVVLIIIILWYVIYWYGTIQSCQILNTKLTKRCWSMAAKLWIISGLKTLKRKKTAAKKLSSYI